MDITKNVLRKLGKEKIPAAILPSLYPGNVQVFRFFFFFKLNYQFIYLEEKSTEESVVPITSVANCIQVLTQCHTKINEQDASRFLFFYRKWVFLEKVWLVFVCLNSSSDSDSDPEGGELPDLAYSKEEMAKKKSKKKRTDKATDERSNKSIRKREVKHDKSQISSTLVNEQFFFFFLSVK